jgi:SAM-dependent methyltransferase
MNDAGEPSGYTPFLLAKRAIDDQALNERIWTRAMSLLGQSVADRSIRILELGAGVGGMLERILTRTAVGVIHYTVVDVEPAHLAALRVELHAFGEREGYRVDVMETGQVILTKGDRRIEVILEHSDVFAFFERRPRESYNLLIAQAFLDLFDIEPLLTLMVEAIEPGGGLYFPITFDGISSWLPVIDAAFDNRVEHLYHKSMDARGSAIDMAPRSQTGRHVVYHLSQRADIAALEAAASDWVVCAPYNSQLRTDELMFLHALLDGYERELTGHFGLELESWHDWLTLRRRYIETGDAVFLAHHLDIFALRQI